MWIGFRSLVLILSVLAFITPRSGAQDISDRIKSIQTKMSNAQAAYDQLPANVKKTVLPDHRLFGLLSTVKKMGTGLAKGANPSWQPSAGWDVGGADENGLIQVNNPARDLRFSPFVGYTQTDASTARCGQTVVVAFNDSGSTLETLLSGSAGVTAFPGPPAGTGGISTTGYATSHNGGESFNDRGAVNPGPDVNTFLMGRPSVACSDSSSLYMVQEARFKSPFGYLNPAQGIALSRSNDGGATWSDPVNVTIPATIDPNNPFFDSFSDPRVAVDPSNHQRVLVSYVHFQADAFCSVSPDPSLLSTVEVLVSTDGGNTFAPNPVVMDSQCLEDTFQIHAGTRIAMGSDGTAYVAWETSNVLFSAAIGTAFPDAIAVASFSPTGRALPAVVVDSVFQLRGALMFEPFFGIGLIDGGLLLTDFTMQGGFLNPRGFDLAVDRSGGPKDGTVYVAWDDGRNGANAANEIEDVLFLAYTFTDIRVSTSSDQGQTFTPSQQLNSDQLPLKARPHDHFRPVLAVDRKGEVAACWYDRRNDPQNYQFERFCAESADGGATWTEFNIPGSLSTPSTQQDWLVQRDDMGHNDDLTTDFINHDPGFLGGIQWMSSGMNPDVKLVKFQ